MTSVTLWDARARRMLQRLDGARVPVAFTCDGKQFLSMDQPSFGGREFVRRQLCHLPAAATGSPR